MSKRCLLLLGAGMLAAPVLLTSLPADPPLELTHTATATTDVVDAVSATAGNPVPDREPPAHAPSEILSNGDPTRAVAQEEQPGPDLTLDEPELSIETPVEITDAIQGEIEDSQRIQAPGELEPAPSLVDLGPPPLRREDLDVMAARLVAIEQAMGGQQQRALEMVVSSNRTALMVAGSFAAVGILGIMVAAFFLIRVLNRFFDVMMTLPMGQELNRSRALPAFALEDLNPAASTAIEQVSARFLGAIEQLEKRIRELEGTPALESEIVTAGNGATDTAQETHEPLIVAASTGSTASVNGSGNGAAGSPRVIASRKNEKNERHRRVQLLLGEGEKFLQQDQAEQALERFEDALALEPNNAEALIKKGMTLERLQRMEAALECYDRAIAANASMTLAYLHKGAVCNRLQRYREALECYERALQTEQKPQ
jgi:hypothetical protein